MQTSTEFGVDGLSRGPDTADGPVATPKNGERRGRKKLKSPMQSQDLAREAAQKIEQALHEEMHVNE